VYLSITSSEYQRALLNREISLLFSVLNIKQTKAFNFENFVSRLQGANTHKTQLHLLQLSIFSQKWPWLLLHWKQPLQV